MPVQQPMILTTMPLAGNGVYTSPWFDSSMLPCNYIELSSYSDQASAAGGVVIQESDDITNANLTGTANTDTAGAATLERMISPIRKRYWRVVYTNGATIQATFELAMGMLGNIPAQVDDSGNIISPQQSNSWSVSAQPATGSVAVAVKAATPGQRHVCTAILATWAAAVAPVATILIVQVLDGVTVIWTGVCCVQALAGDRGQIALNGLNLQGSSNGSMTVQFTAALANLAEAVSMNGYDLQ